MKNNKIIFLVFLFLVLIGCKEESKFFFDKKYWDVVDYDNVIREVKFGIEFDEKLLIFDNFDIKFLVEKLIDEENFKVVLDDN